MIIQVNSEHPEIQALGDKVAIHVDSGRPETLRRTNDALDSGKPVVISTDGSTARKGGLGSTPESTREAAMWAHSIGASFEHLSIPLWEMGWAGKPARVNKEVSEEMSVIHAMKDKPKLRPRSGVKARDRLIGYSSYGALADPLVDIERFLGWLAHIGANHTRVFLVDQFSHHRIRGSSSPRSGPPWRPSLKRMIGFIDVAYELGISVTISLLDRWQMEMRSGEFSGAGYRMSPWRPIADGLLLSVGEYPGRIDKAFKGWKEIVGRVLQNLDNSSGKGKNVILELVNEPDYWKPHNLRASVRLHEEMVDFIRSWKVTQKPDEGPPGLPDKPKKSALYVAGRRARRVAEFLEGLEGEDGGV